MSKLTPQESQLVAGLDALNASTGDRVYGSTGRLDEATAAPVRRLQEFGYRMTDRCRHRVAVPNSGAHRTWRSSSRYCRAQDPKAGRRRRTMTG
jgi:hypothetical protein